MATALRTPPGLIRDAIIRSLTSETRPLPVAEIVARVRGDLGTVATSSVRSYLNLNTPELFVRTGLGVYRLASDALPAPAPVWRKATIDRAEIINADCFDWLAARDEKTVHAIVSDPPYGLVEYTDTEKQKLRAGKGGVWRVPPSFDGYVRAPLPRFTTLRAEELTALHDFFLRFGRLALRVLVPGGHVVLAGNPLLTHIVGNALTMSGLENRGSIARLVMTMRGGDRPKNAHHEFADVSVMPRSMWEPWLIFRRPVEGRVQDNLRVWSTGGFRRRSATQPFGDVIRSSPTPSREKKIAPHPSLKPQDFMRQLVRGVLPLASGVVVDPFCGAGSTLAAANAVGYDSIGIEADPDFFDMACAAVPSLAALAI